MKRRDKKIDKRFEVKTQKMLDFFQGISLNGILNECFVIVKKGNFYIEAVDITNSMIIEGRRIKVLPVQVDDLELGFGDIDFLIKFLMSLDNETFMFEKKENYLILSVESKSTNKNLHYLLTHPDLIVTRLNLPSEEDSDKSQIKKIINKSDFSTFIPASFVKDHCIYVALVKGKSKNGDNLIKVIVDKKITFVYGEDNEHYLCLEMQSEFVSEEKFEVKIDGDHLAKIFNKINYMQSDPPRIYFGDAQPVVVQVEKMGYALIPIIEGEM